MKKKANHTWFGPMKNLRGITPVSQEGWTVTLLFFALLIIDGLIYPRLPLLALILGLVLFVLFGVIVWKTGGRYNPNNFQ